MCPIQIHAGTVRGLYTDPRPNTDSCAEVRRLYTFLGLPYTAQLETVAFPRSPDADWMRQPRWRTVFRTLRLNVLLVGVTTLLLLLLLLFYLVPALPWRHVQISGEGVPLTLLWTMMRSGSRMTQSLLSAQQCSFYTEEPLREYVAEGLNTSLNILHNLLACNISMHSDLVTQWINGSHANLGLVRSVCRDYPRLCWNGELLDALCQASCLRLVRVVAQGLSLALILLQEQGSSIHVIHLVRDPRGMISSRRELQRLPTGNMKLFREEELDVAIICQRYRHDLTIAEHLTRHSPDR